LAELLSPAWIAAADAAVAAANLALSEPLVVQNDVVRSDGTVATYHVEVTGAGARLRSGAHADPTVTYRLPITTAQGIASGDLDPYAEFMAGRLEVDGDTTKLVDHQDLIAALQAAIAAAS
jgi:putative sterol carrier protein